MKKAFLFAALITASATALADDSCLKQPAFSITGAPELRPSQVWADPAGLLHLQFGGATLSDMKSMPLSRAEDGSYSIPATEMVTRNGYTELTVLDPVSTLVLKHLDREAVVAVR